MPISIRYTDIRNGGIVMTGNTLGLSKSANANAPGQLGSIGAFTSLNLSLQVGNFPPGTTLDYTQNGSSAQLNLPAGSGILHAELIWGGLYRSTVNDISGILNQSVLFTAPDGAHTVAPDPATAENFVITTSGVTVGFYVRSADVTSIVAGALGGTYSTQRVPALIEALDARTSETNHAGWTLAVVYENLAEPLRDLTLWSGGTVVSPNTGGTDISLTGFLIPDHLPITGRLFVSVQEGDAVLSGDQLLFGENTASLTPVSGPNNPVSNFFASQINNASGTLDTSGTFGARNANAAAGTNTTACRQGWDITAVDVSSLLSPGMTMIAMRFTTNGDLYVPNCIAFAVDSEGAHLELNKTVDKAFAAVGEPIHYAVDVHNSGSIPAEKVTLVDLLPNEAELVGDVLINGVPYGGALPVSFGPVQPGETAVVSFTVVVQAIPPQNPIFNVAQAEYTYMPFPGYEVRGIETSNIATCYIYGELVAVAKSAEKALATAGETINYTSVVTNGGNGSLINLVFRDPVPAGTAFVPGSVTVNGVSYPSYDPAAGFPLPDLAAGESATVAFSVIINETGEKQMIIVNQSNVTFDYVLPDHTTRSGEQASNLVQTEVLTYSVSRVKSTDKTFLSEGETARQTVVITNLSTAALTALNFKDTMTTGATYVAGSVAVNGVSQPSYDPNAGFALLDIPAGGLATISYSILANNPRTDVSVTNNATFNYTVNDSIRGPVSYSENTNDIVIALVATGMTVVKRVDKAYAISGELLHYTSIVTNTGSLDKINIVFTDDIPVGTTFVTGSVKINGVSYPAYDPAAGFTLPNLAPGNGVTVEFDVRVV